MRALIIVLILAIPTSASELCVIDGASICCHFMCDVYSPTAESGYSTLASLFVAEPVGVEPGSWGRLKALYRR